MSAFASSKELASKPDCMPATSARRTIGSKTSNPPLYIGRFAPSPTGPLHMGSLFAAVVSYLHAKQHKGKWLLRIEDIDPLREDPLAKDHILSTLEAHQLYWDDTPSFQSQHNERYAQQLQILFDNGYAFRCPCSRKYLAQNQSQHHYFCQRRLDIALRQIPHSIKFRANQKNYTWLDGYQGKCSQALVDDFVLKRKEGFYAYQLAVVCDDIDQGITHVVRGSDLIPSTGMQLALYEALNKQAPTFFHLPVICQNGKKLSKQNLAPAIDNRCATQNLYFVLSMLGISDINTRTPCHEALEIAVETWSGCFSVSGAQINM